MPLLTPLITNSGWIYGQAALHHPPGYRRGYPMYYPKENGERDFRGKRYTKYVRIANPNERPTQPYSSDPCMDPWATVIPLTEITEKVNCVRAFRAWEQQNNIRDARKEVINAVLRRAEIPTNYVGLGGSTALGCDRPDADIDIFIYGSWNAIRCIREIEKMLHRGELSLMKKKIAQSYADRYAELYGLARETLFNLFAQDLTKVYVAEKKISFIFLYDEREVASIPPQIYTNSLGPDTHIVGRVVSGVSSWIYPRQYLIRSQGGILYSVWSHHWLYKGMAASGAPVEIVGHDCGNQLLTISALHHKIISL